MGFVIRLLGFLALVALSVVMALVLGTLYSLPIFLMRVYLGPGSLFDWVPLLVALTHATLLVLVILLRRVPRVFGKIVLYSFLALLLSYPSYLATIPLSGHGWEYGLLIGVPFLAAVLFPRVLVYVFELAWKIFSAMALHLGGLIASLLNRAVGSISPGIGVHVAGIEVVSLPYEYLRRAGGPALRGVYYGPLEARRHPRATDPLRREEGQDPPAHQSPHIQRPHPKTR